MALMSMQVNLEVRKLLKCARKYGRNFDVLSIIIEHKTTHLFAGCNSGK